MSGNNSVGGQGGPVLVIGGAGFIGSNLAHGLLSRGQSVRIFDNLSRPGVEHNLGWLRASHGDQLEVVIDDVCNRTALAEAMRDVSAVFHLAAQVAVTTSLRDPVHDFEVNVCGSLNVLEALRALPKPPPLVFTSTNKVYGELDGLEFEESDDRYEPADKIVGSRGVNENQPLCFRSPYGCSKGAADQYVLDYARTFGLPATVFRMSCIYGPHQLGNEEQGWVAHFVRCALQGAGVTIYGNGKQVRDVLFVGDLVEAFLCAWQHIDRISGQAFNIGGGPQNSISLLELLDMIEALWGKSLEVGFSAWRPGDQRYYVSDIQAFQRVTGWAPHTDVRAGLTALHDWLASDMPGTAETAARSLDIPMPQQSRRIEPANAMGSVIGGATGAAMARRTPEG